jgi:hypothetical protein
MSDQSSLPPVTDYPGYFEGKPPIHRRKRVQVVGAGLAGLLLGIIVGGGTGTAEPEQTDRGSGGGTQATIEKTADKEVRDAVAHERDVAAKQLAKERQRAAALVAATRSKAQAKAAAQVRAAKHAAKVSQGRAVAAAVKRAKQQAQSQAPRSFTNGGGSNAPASTDPHFSYCYEANDAGFGPYRRGTDPEYDWYDDADGDGVVCEP